MFAPVKHMHGRQVLRNGDVSSFFSGFLKNKRYISRCCSTLTLSSPTHRGCCLLVPIPKLPRFLWLIAASITPVLTVSLPRTPTVPGAGMGVPVFALIPMMGKRCIDWLGKDCSLGLIRKNCRGRNLEDGGGCESIRSREPCFQIFTKCDLSVNKFS